MSGVKEVLPAKGGLLPFSIGSICGAQHTWWFLMAVLHYKAQLSQCSKHLVSYCLKLWFVCASSMERHTLFHKYLFAHLTTH